MVVITGSGSDWLLGEAASAGLPVIIEPSLRAPIDLRSDARALRRLAALPRQGNFGVVHTHCAKAGSGPAGRASQCRVADRAHVPWLPVSRIPVGPRRRAYVAIERRLGRLTDATLCVGTGVAVEAIRRGLAALERVRVVGVVVSSA